MSALCYFRRTYPIRAMTDEVRDLHKNFHVFIALALKYVSGNIHYRSLSMNTIHIPHLKFRSREMCKIDLHYGSDKRESLR